jgi:hypothetical protein
LLESVGLYARGKTFADGIHVSKDF